MMLEETLIRETAQAKHSTRQSSTASFKGPPVATFAGLPTEDSKSEASVDTLNENNFDVVSSPMRREGSIADGKSAAKMGKMVP